MEVWERIVSFHLETDLLDLVGIYALGLGGLVLAIVLLSLARGRALAIKAWRAVQDLRTDVNALTNSLDGLTENADGWFEKQTGELNDRIEHKMAQKGDFLEGRLEERTSALTDSIHKLNSRLSKANEDVVRFRERVDEVERRIPSLFDRLDEFRDTLGRTFQAELGGVLSSFDTSLSGLLHQMKADLEMGLSRIEGIEGVMKSRDRAERSLLSGTPAEALPAALEEDDGQFAEWEEEAKDLADEEEEESEEEDVNGLLEAIAAPEVENEAEGGPGEGEGKGPETGPGYKEGDTEPPSIQ